jgi:hypothetical protein
MLTAFAIGGLGCLVAYAIVMVAEGCGAKI